MSDHVRTERLVEVGHEFEVDDAGTRLLFRWTPEGIQCFEVTEERAMTESEYVRYIENALKYKGIT